MAAGLAPTRETGDVGVTTVSDPASGRTVREDYDYHRDGYRVSVQTKGGPALALPERDGLGRLQASSYDAASGAVRTRLEDDFGSGSVVERQHFKDGSVLETTRGRAGPVEAVFTTATGRRISAGEEPQKTAEEIRHAIFTEGRPVAEVTARLGVKEADIVALLEPGHGQHGSGKLSKRLY